MHEKDRSKTGFTVLNQTYVFNRMPFGLCNAPRTFQSAMLDLFGKFTFVKVFLDDILIHSRDEIEHADHLAKVLKILQNNNISINFEKSNFGLTKVVYLGHEISKHGIKPDITRIQTFKMPTIKKKKDLQRILGLINWFRNFIPDCAKLLHPIYDKLKDKDNIIWKEEDTKRILEILEIIKRKTLLNFPKIDKPYDLYSDASESALGGILIQENKLIGIYSYRLKKAEKNYSTVELETLAILKSAIHFKNIIFNSKIKVWTDNKNLIVSKCTTKRINRWKLLLEEFDLEYNHIEGKENIGADSISRIMMIHETDKGKKLKEIFEKYLKRENNVWISNNEKGEEEFLYRIHEYYIHPGIEKLYQTLKRNIVMKKLKEKIRKIIVECIKCNEEKHFTKSTHISQGYYKGEKILESLALDIKGPISTAYFNHDEGKHCFYILAIVDMLSRYTKTRILYDITGKSVISAIEQILIDKFTKPKTILTDQGRQFISNDFNKFIRKYSIKHILTSPYNPSCNGVVERINKVIGEVLRLSRGCYVREIEEKIDRRLNRLVHSTSGEIPHKIIHEGISEEKTKQIKEKFKKQYTDRANKINKAEEQYQEGDEIYKYKFPINKMDKTWSGPYKVVKVNQNTLVIKENEREVSVSKKHVRKRGQTVMKIDHKR